MKIRHKNVNRTSENDNKSFRQENMENDKEPRTCQSNEFLNYSLIRTQFKLWSEKHSGKIEMNE